jgi:hypothetical protein
MDMKDFFIILDTISNFFDVGIFHLQFCMLPDLDPNNTNMPVFYFSKIGTSCFSEKPLEPPYPLQTLKGLGQQIGGG